MGHCVIKEFLVAKTNECATVGAWVSTLHALGPFDSLEIDKTAIAGRRSPEYDAVSGNAVAKSDLANSDIAKHVILDLVADGEATQELNVLHISGLRLEHLSTIGERQLGIQEHLGADLRPMGTDESGENSGAHARLVTTRDFHRIVDGLDGVLAIHARARFDDIQEELPEYIGQIMARILADRGLKRHLE